MASIGLKDDRSETVHYDFEDYPIYIRKALLSSYHNFETPPHWHDDLEFIVVLYGKINYNINGEIITLAQNDGVLVNSRQLHCGFSREKSDCEFICILIHPLMLCVSQTLEQKYISPLLRNPSMPYVKLSAGISWQKEILNSILQMYDRKDSATAPLIICSLFLKVWSILFENSDISTSCQNQNNDFSILKNMIGYIQKAYREKITLDDIAASGSVGQSKCCKLFDKYSGVTPNIYLIQYRLHQSIWYLSNTDMTITEIAQAVGFSGSSYYAEVFRKYYSISPSEYRKTNRPTDSHK